MAEDGDGDRDEAATVVTLHGQLVRIHRKLDLLGDLVDLVSVGDSDDEPEN